ncbi:MAG TPA: glycosyltransferase family 2 protein [Candidatus Binatia bacterium]|nr:glycosyltransferase family 2 protein [Candidatus Binatia bacterium]
MSLPLLSIVVPTYNRRHILSRTLPSLLGQNDPGADYEVIVVVDGSTDGTLEMLDRKDWGPRLRVVRQPNRGQARARNHGAEEARGEILLFLDDDMIAACDLLSVHREAHGTSRERVVLGQMGLAAGVRRSFLKQGVADWGREFAERVSAPGYAFRFDDWHSGHASIARSLFLGVGGFDEAFVAYGNEDYDLGMRLIQRGADMRFEPRAEAVQIYDKTFTAWLRDVRSVGRADVFLAGKHPAISPALRLSGQERHPLKRLARRSGTSSFDWSAGAWTVLTWTLIVAERLSLRGALLGHAQSLMGERAYWRGVRDARRPRVSIGTAALKRPWRAA